MSKHDLRLIEEGNIMLGYACEYGYLAFVKFICKNIKINPACPQKISSFTNVCALSRCAAEKKYDIFDYLVKRYSRTIQNNRVIYTPQLQECITILTKNKQTKRAQVISDLLLPTEIVVDIPTLVQPTPDGELVCDKSKDECV
jgi:hypothetical protein